MFLAKQTVLSLYTEASESFARSTAAALAGDRSVQDKEHKRAEGLFKWAEKSEAASRLEAAISPAKSETGVPVLPSQLDSDPWVLNVFNGMVDLRSGILLFHDKTKLLTKMAPVQYDPDASLELWDHFLLDILPIQKRDTMSSDVLRQPSLARQTMISSWCAMEKEAQVRARFLTQYNAPSGITPP